MIQTSQPLQYASVCSGIEAVTVAWKPLGITPVWFSEIAPFPCAVLAHHFPEVPNLGDMKQLASQVLDESIPAPAVLIGGTPCQAFSVAGFRAGLEDARGALTLTFVELANAIDQVRTRRHEPEAIIVWENVLGVLTDKGNAFGCFLAALAGEEDELVPPGKAWSHAGIVFGPQRTIAWRVLDAQYFGLAQRRRRVFLVASAGVGLDPAAVLFESESLRRDIAPYRTPQAKAAFPVEAGAVECERLQGLPDNYTRIPRRHYAIRRVSRRRPLDMWEATDSGWTLMAADGPRYKAIGNTMAVPCLIWLGKRLLSVLSKSGTVQEGIDH